MLLKILLLDLRQQPVKQFLFAATDEHIATGNEKLAD
jgi:hypothetical protein